MAGAWGLAHTMGLGTAWVAEKTVCFIVGVDFKRLQHHVRCGAFTPLPPPAAAASACVDAPCWKLEAGTALDRSVTDTAQNSLHGKIVATP
jgi:hypothetical protein